MARPMKKTCRIPLFPLDVVLFPGAPLPLHIFEPRYKIMVRRCLSDRTEFGMILASEKGMATVGCTAEIVQKLKEYPDGRMDILTEGKTAFAIHQLIQEKEYFEAAVEFFREEERVSDDDSKKSLVELFEQFSKLIHGQVRIDFLDEKDIPLAYSMAARLPLELTDRQALLEMRRETERRSFLENWLNEMVPRLLLRQQARKWAGNGHGLN
jgi:Lon protease-like protein